MDQWLLNILFLLFFTIFLKFLFNMKILPSNKILILYKNWLSLYNWSLIEMIIHAKILKKNAFSFKFYLHPRNAIHIRSYFYFIKDAKQCLEHLNSMIYILRSGKIILDGHIYCNSWALMWEIPFFSFT